MRHSWLRHSWLHHSWLTVLVGGILLASLPGCASISASTSDNTAVQEHGSRTMGSFIEDANIERKASNKLATASGALAASHLVVVSFNGNVLLAGQVSNQSLSTQAENIVRSVEHVRHVYNALEISGNSSALARTNDAWLTAKVKSRLLVDGNTPASRTKVVTEDGVVYLMGLLTHKEASEVVAQVQQVGGVQKIVKVIQYID